MRSTNHVNLTECWQKKNKNACKSALNYLETFLSIEMDRIIILYILHVYQSLWCIYTSAPEVITIEGLKRFVNHISAGICFSQFVIHRAERNMCSFLLRIVLVVKKQKIILKLIVTAQIGIFMSHQGCNSTLNLHILC